MPNSAVMTVSISVIALLVGAAFSALAARRAAYERVMKALYLETAPLRANAMSAATPCHASPAAGPEAATSMCREGTAGTFSTTLTRGFRDRDVVVSLPEV